MVSSAQCERAAQGPLLAQEVEGQYLDMDGTDALAFRVKGDGRAYIASLRTENWIVGSASHDVWQAFLFARCCVLSLLHVVCSYACRSAYPCMHERMHNWMSPCMPSLWLRAHQSYSMRPGGLFSQRCMSLSPLA